MWCIWSISDYTQGIIWTLKGMQARSTRDCVSNSTLIADVIRPEQTHARKGGFSFHVSNYHATLVLRAWRHETTIHEKYNMPFVMTFRTTQWGKYYKPCRWTITIHASKALHIMQVKPSPLLQVKHHISFTCSITRHTMQVKQYTSCK